MITRTLISSSNLRPKTRYKHELTSVGSLVSNLALGTEMCVGFVLHQVGRIPSLIFFPLELMALTGMKYGMAMLVACFTKNIPCEGIRLALAKWV
jgi:hypothetical protein